MIKLALLALSANLITGCTSAWAQPAEHAAAAKQSVQPVMPPGKLVEIGGRKMHIIDGGEGSPVVVLLPGMGDFSVDWARVQPESNRLTRTISYDRAGEGWSDPAAVGSPTGLEAEAADVHRALEAVKARPPYILVGHS